MERAGTLRLSRRSLIKGGLCLMAGGVISQVSASSHKQVAAQAVTKRIYLAPDDHTDYFWSAGEADYQQAFLSMLDYYLAQADATLDNPADFQSRWNCDGNFWLWVYERNRTRSQFQHLMERVRSGHIGVPLNALCSCLGAVPTEAILRGMYYGGQIERTYDLRLKLAYTMENQTQPYGLNALWYGAGARYSWKGICGCDTQLPNAGDREHEIYWAVGPDGSRVLTKWNSMLGANLSIGGYAEANCPSCVVDLVDGDASFMTRYPYQVIGAFGQGWDNLQTMDQACVNVAQAKSNATRRVIVSNMQDFFEDFEATYGNGLPSVACTFGNEWELYAAAIAEVSARMKRAVEKLRAAEALATLVSLVNPSFMDGRRATRDQAWMDLGLFWEHNLGMFALSADRMNERVAWQRRLAGEVEGYVNTLSSEAAIALGGMIRKSGASPRFYAFNPLGWVRTDAADFPYAAQGPVHVIDLSSGQEAPSQFVSIDGQQYLRVWAQDIPAVGYKVFEVRPGAGSGFADAATVSNNILENDRYRITMAERGAITSLVDKVAGNREFARGIGGRFLNDLGAASGALQVESVGPVSVTLRATASAPLQHTTRVTLIRGLDRIDIRNDIEQGFADTHTWAFGFELGTPDVWHEEAGAVIRAKLLANGGHYSSRNARYDWLTLNHFADMSSGAGGVTLSNADCYFMRLGNSTVSALDVNTPQISPLAGGRVVNGSNGLPNQGGDTHFLQRFALRTHGAYDPAQAMRFALEHQNPLITGAVTGGSAYPEISYSLLSISNPNVLLWALKPADDGIAEQGIIARLWNLSPNPANFALSFPSHTIQSAQHTTHIETPLGSAPLVGGALSDLLSQQQLKTYALAISDTTGTPVATSTSTRTPTASATATHTRTASPTATSSATAAPTPTRTPTATLMPPTATLTNTPTATASLSGTPSVTASTSVTASPSRTVTFTPWPSITLTLTPRASSTPSATPSLLPTITQGIQVYIPLCLGWNLISLPLSPSGHAAEEILASIQGCYDQVCVYDRLAGTGQWRCYSPVYPPSSSAVLLDELKGIWIHATVEATLVVEGTPVSGADIGLHSGWNLVGYPGRTTRPIREALASIEGQYALVYGYEAATPRAPWRLYDPAIPAVLNSLTELRPGYGYWIRALADCVWSVSL